MNPIELDSEIIGTYERPRMAIAAPCYCDRRRVLN